LVKGCGVWLVNATLLPQGPTPNDAFPTSDFGLRLMPLAITRAPPEAVRVGVLALVGVPRIAASNTVNRPAGVH
jgi:hypothetical protein